MKLIGISSLMYEEKFESERFRFGWDVSGNAKSGQPTERTQCCPGFRPLARMFQLMLIGLSSSMDEEGSEADDLALRGISAEAESCSNSKS